MTIIQRLIQSLKSFKYFLKNSVYMPNYPNVSSNAVLGFRNFVVNPKNLIMGNKTSLKRDSVIMNRRAKFIMTENNGAAEQLLVVTGNHMSIVGKNVKQVTDKVKDLEDKYHEFDKDVIVEEDVWIGARVTILSGVTVSRGCILGTSCVLRSTPPPYSIVIGNPAKVIGFRFTPNEIIEHEKILYPEDKRLPIDLLKENYKKFFLSRVKEIKAYTSLQL